MNEETLATYEKHAEEMLRCNAELIYIDPRTLKEFVVVIREMQERVETLATKLEQHQVPWIFKAACQDIAMLVRGVIDLKEPPHGR